MNSYSNSTLADPFLDSQLGWKEGVRRACVRTGIVEGI